MRVPSCRSRAHQVKHSFLDIPKREVSTEYKILESSNIALVIPITHCNPYFILVYFFALAAV